MAALLLMVVLKVCVLIYYSTSQIKFAVVRLFVVETAVSDLCVVLSRQVCYELIKQETQFCLDLLRLFFDLVVSGLNFVSQFNCLVD